MIKICRNFSRLTNFDEFRLCCRRIESKFDEGICQLLFFEGDPCETTYSDRKGKYQYQQEKVTLAKV